MPETNNRAITASDGMQLNFRHWKAATSPIGAVVCLHGIQSHSGWYEYSSARLADEGFNVYFADRRGSGLNDQQRGHADHGMRLLNDVVQLIDMVRRENPNLPLSLLGLSWGGKIAAAVAASGIRDIDRLVLLYPGLVPKIGPNLWQRFLLWFARSHDMRHKPVTIPLQDPALFTNVARWQEFIRTDSLALRQVTSGFINAGLDLDRMLRSSQSRLPPTLVMLAGNDQIINNVETRRLLKSVPATALNIVEYADAQHTLEFEANREAIFDDLITWLRDETFRPSDRDSPENQR